MPTLKRSFREPFPLCSGNGAKINNTLALAGSRLAAGFVNVPG